MTKCISLFPREIRLLEHRLKSALMDVTAYAFRDISEIIFGDVRNSGRSRDYELTNYSKARMNFERNSRVAGARELENQDTRCSVDVVGTILLKN